jgi:hypothetical protein
MSDDKEHRVRVRAYHIWERKGRAGRAEDHWLEAEAEMHREATPPSAGLPSTESAEQPKKTAKRSAAPPGKAKKTQAGASETSQKKPVKDRSKKEPAAAKADAPRSRRTPPA